MAGAGGRGRCWVRKEGRCTARKRMEGREGGEGGGGVKRAPHLDICLYQLHALPRLQHRQRTPQKMRAKHSLSFPKMHSTMSQLPIAVQCSAVQAEMTEHSDMNTPVTKLPHLAVQARPGPVPQACVEGGQDLRPGRGRTAHHSETHVRGGTCTKSDTDPHADSAVRGSA